VKAKPMKSVPSGWEPCEPGEATHVRLCMPGPFANRILKVQPGSPTGWRWNGSTESPTLTPSILTRGGVGDVGEYTEHVCHSFVTDGRVQFLSDCTHEFAGQTVDLLEVD